MTHFDRSASGRDRFARRALFFLGHPLLAFHDQRHPPLASRRLTSKGSMKKKDRDHSLFRRRHRRDVAHSARVQFHRRARRKRGSISPPKKPTPFPPAQGPSWPNSIPRCRSAFTAPKIPRRCRSRLATYAQRVEDLLGEYKQASKGKMEIQRLDPAARFRRGRFGAARWRRSRSHLRTGERIYLGVCASMLDQKQAIPFLTPDRERLLEYDISRADRPRDGFGKTGRRGNERAARHGRHEPHDDDAQGQQDDAKPWAFISELQRDFNVKQVEITADKIPDDIKVLLVIHPKGISDVAQFALDQFVLRGGKLIAFVDPLCALDRPPGSAWQSATAEQFDPRQIVQSLGHRLSFESGGRGRRTRRAACEENGIRRCSL